MSTFIPGIFCELKARETDNDYLDKRREVCNVLRVEFLSIKRKIFVLNCQTLR